MRDLRNLGSQATLAVSKRLTTTVYHHCAVPDCLNVTWPSQLHVPVTAGARRDLPLDIRPRHPCALFPHLCSPTRAAVEPVQLPQRRPTRGPGPTGDAASADSRPCSIAASPGGRWPSCLPAPEERCLRPRSASLLCLIATPPLSAPSCVAARHASHRRPPAPLALPQMARTVPREYITQTAPG